MSRAASNFLQGANAANAAFGTATALPATIDDAQVLAAVSKAHVSDVSGLAEQLGVAKVSIEPVVERLSRQGLVEIDPAELKLSKAGERALRYTDLASF